MCNWHWAITQDGKLLGSVPFGGGVRSDPISEKAALRKAIRLAAGATNRERDKRETVTIERCSCNGAHETVYPFLAGGLVEPEHLWAEWDPFYSDEEEREQPIYRLWSAATGAEIADGLVYAEALARAEAAPDDLVVLKQPSSGAYTFVCFDKTGGSWFRAQRLPLREWLGEAG